MRHFYCRDVLWETFEQMANDFDCSIDYLINEAMRFYARSKNYQAGTASSQSLPQQGGVPANGPSAGAPPTPPARSTPAPPNPRVTPEPVAAGGPTLFLVFNNQRIPIDKDQFIIGR